ncbi:hypothetical protein ACJPL6_004199, partial [Cronobacter malonaticus]
YISLTLPAATSQGSSAQNPVIPYLLLLTGTQRCCACATAENCYEGFPGAYRQTNNQKKCANNGLREAQPHYQRADANSNYGRFHPRG